jgi:thioredoxin reductase
MASSQNGHAELVVIGGGPGGYPAAFQAVDRDIDLDALRQRKSQVEDAGQFAMEKPTDA